jgi:hypothetical protein
MSDPTRNQTTAAITSAAAINWLHEAAAYFERRPTGGEDAAHWSNVYNAENCRRIARLIAGKEDQNA